MFGVVLWSDQLSGSAVIWCEDHGDLAYFDASVRQAVGETKIATSSFDAGDLVEFEVSMKDNRLVALNPVDLRREYGEMQVHALQQTPRAEREAAPITPCQAAPVIDLNAHKPGHRPTLRAVNRRG